MSNNLYDLSGVLRYQQGSAQTPWRIEAAYNEAEALLNASGGMFILTKTFQTTRWFRWSWKWPPFQIRVPRVPPGFRLGFCLGVCGPAIYDIIHNYFGTCATIEGTLQRIHCALCTTWKRGGGMGFALAFCGGCLCMMFGSGLIGGVICSGVAWGAMELLCINYPKPEEPPSYYFVPYPVPTPVPVPPYGPPYGPI